MALTSFASFRDEQARLIAALTPDSFEGVPFEEHRDEEDLREWALDHPESCFRRFAIADMFTPTQPAVTNGDVWWWEGSEEVVVAYPKDGRYGAANTGDLFDLMRQDFYAIDAAIGARAGVYASGHAVLEGVNLDEDEEVAFFVFTYTWRFWRGATAVAGITGPGSSTDQAIVIWSDTTGTVVADSATLISALAKLATAQQWTKCQYSNVTTLTSSSNSVAYTVTDGNEYYLNMTEATTLALPTGIVAGMNWKIRVEADGSSELSYAANYKTGTESAKDVSAMADGEWFYLYCHAVSATVITIESSITFS